MAQQRASFSQPPSAGHPRASSTGRRTDGRRTRDPRTRDQWTAGGWTRDQLTRGRRLQRFARWAMLLLVALLAACQPAPPAVDHLALAKDMAAKLTTDGKPADLSDPRYEEVAQELQLVPEDAPTKAEADAWLKQIHDARKAKLFAIQDGPNSPEDARETEGGTTRRKQSARATTKPKHTGTAEGWDPYNTDVDVNAIAAGMKGGGSSGSASGGSSGRTGGSKAKSGALSVTMYSTSWCGYCKQARAYFRQKGISYTDKDIEKDASARAEVMAKARTTSVPVIDVNGQIMVGFDKRAVDQMLASAQ